MLFFICEFPIPIQLRRNCHIKLSQTNFISECGIGFNSSGKAQKFAADRSFRRSPGYWSKHHILGTSRKQKMEMTGTILVSDRMKNHGKSRIVKLPRIEIVF